MSAFPNTIATRPDKRELFAFATPAVTPTVLDSGLLKLADPEGAFTTWTYFNGVEGTQIKHFQQFGVFFGAAADQVIVEDAADGLLANIQLDYYELNDNTSESILAANLKFSGTSIIDIYKVDGQVMQNTAATGAFTPVVIQITATLQASIPGLSELAIGPMN